MESEVKRGKERDIIFFGADEEECNRRRDSRKAMVIIIGTGTGTGTGIGIGEKSNRKLNWARSSV